MKEKIDPTYYLTDSLITSEEWDSFDYHLRLQIKELGRIDYNKQSLYWKKNTLAFSYLFNVEKLLIEKYATGEHAIEDIRELQVLLEKYDHVKTFLLTLRIATLAYRTGLLPKLITEGEKHLKYRDQQQEKAKKERSSQGKTPAETKDRNNQIRDHFKKAHLKFPSLTRTNFANTHAKEYGLKPTRIREILKSPVDT